MLDIVALVQFRWKEPLSPSRQGGSGSGGKAVQYYLSVKPSIAATCRRKHSGLRVMPAVNENAHSLEMTSIG